MPPPLTVPRPRLCEAPAQPAGVRGIPHSFVVGRDNKIVYSGHPMEPGFEAAIKKALDAYAGPPPAPATQPKDIPPPVKATREELMEMSVGELKSTP